MIRTRDKLAREWNRLREQVRIGVDALRDPFLRRRHDRLGRRSLTIHEGAVKPSGKLALLLVYQPGGLFPSTLETCRFLADNGYAPLVISNAELTVVDVERLHPVAWKAVVRPNFGYDFGGYRDGIWLLTRWGVEVDSLIILNDSVYFPLLVDPPFLEEMEARQEDLVGLKFTKTRRMSEGERHFESYFFRVSRSAFRSPAFQQFWNGYRQTSNKFVTVRRGERRFTVVMRESGLSCGELYPLERIDAAIQGLTPAQLTGVLRATTCSARSLLQRRDSALEQLKGDSPGPAATGEARAFLQRVAREQLIFNVCPLLTVGVMQVPFFKRTGGRWIEAGQQSLLDAWEQEGLPSGNHVMMREMKDRLERVAER